jgi:drug/metabolite transporter (DMT)-like permease
MTWCTTSLGMAVLNKRVVMVLQTPALISIVQMVMAALIMGPFAFKSLMQTDWRQLRTWLIVPLFFASMLCSSFYTYSYINLSLMTLIRTLAPLIVLPLEHLFMPAGQKPRISGDIIIALLAMLVGATVYAGGLKDMSLIGVAFGLANLVLAASDRMIQRRLLTNECKDLAPSVCTLVNNVFGMFPLILLAGYTGQLQNFKHPEVIDHWMDPNVLALLLMSGVVGIGICYLGFECQRAISATSFFVLQNISKVAVVVAGVVIFGDPVKSPSAVMGLLLSLGGSAFYGKIQLEQSVYEKQESERKKLLT